MAMSNFHKAVIAAQSGAWGAVAPGYFVTRNARWVCGPISVTVHHGRTPVWRDGVYIARAEGRAERDALRASRRERDLWYKYHLGQAKMAAREGVRFGYTDGQEGGTLAFLLLGNRFAQQQVVKVSARGLFRALFGFTPDWGELENFVALAERGEIFGPYGPRAHGRTPVRATRHALAFALAAEGM